VKLSEFVDFLDKNVHRYHMSIERGSLWVGLGHPYRRNSNELAPFSISLFQNEISNSDALIGLISRWNEVGSEYGYVTMSWKELLFN
jgi:hypothetical protein